MSEWIKVEDKTPDIDASVLVYFSDNECMAVNMSGYIKACMDGEEYSPMWSLVTHWMLLPKPPIE